MEEKQKKLASKINEINRFFEGADLDKEDDEIEDLKYERFDLVLGYLNSFSNVVEIGRYKPGKPMGEGGLIEVETQEKANKAVELCDKIGWVGEIVHDAQTIIHDRDPTFSKKIGKGYYSGSAILFDHQQQLAVDCDILDYFHTPAAEKKAREVLNELGFEFHL